MEVDFIINLLLLIGFATVIFFYIRKQEGITDLLFIVAILVLLGVVIRRDIDFAVPLICLIIIDEIRRTRREMVKQ